MMDLDSAIRHCEEVAKEQDVLCKRYDDASGYTRSHNEEIRTSNAKRCEECAADHRQLAEWLKELKAYKAEEYTCDGCKHFDHGEEIECWACSRHHVKKYDNWEAKE